MRNPSILEALTGSIVQLKNPGHSICTSCNHKINNSRTETNKCESKFQKVLQINPPIQSRTIENMHINKSNAEIGQ